MSDSVFQKVVSNLTEIDYSGLLEWSGYAEHFAEESFLGRLTVARSALPRARMIVFTNGDYLNRDLVKRVFGLGVRLHVDLYPPEGEEFNEAKIADTLHKFQRRTGLRVQSKSENSGGWGDYVLFDDNQKSISRLKVGKYSRDNIFTRAGALQTPKTQSYRRKAVCLKPIYHINVNYNGKGMLCCHTRSDVKAHESVIIADLSQQQEDLFSFFAALAPARAALLDPTPKTGICSSCDDDAEGAPSGILARTRAVSMVVGTVKRLVG